MKIRTDLACKIAGIDRNRFNEAVSANHYPCAPFTPVGVTRKFEEFQTIALAVYGGLLNRGLSPQMAGRISCEIQDQLRRHPDEDEIVILQTVSGTLEGLPGSKAKGDLRFYGGETVLSEERFKIANVREYVRRQIKEELSTLGEDDGSP